jgi:probable F420-dependent oxidoreductase
MPNGPWWQRRAEEAGIAVDVYVVLPTYGPGSSAAEVIESGVLAERLGFDGIASTDHFFVPPGSPERFERVFEAITVLAALAPVTSRVKLLLSVLILPMRNPVIAAKQVATLDQLSGGRVILGLGAGWNEEEFRNVGAEFGDRGRRLDEGIALLRHLFSGSREPFTGEHYGYADGVFGPPPVRGRDLPILIGGTSGAALRRAATAGDLWESNPVIGPGDYPALLRRLRAIVPGRRVQAGARVNIGPGVTDAAAAAMAYAEAGAEHLLLEFFPFDDFGARLRQFAREVLPQLSALDVSRR